LDSQKYQRIIKGCRFCLMCRHVCTVGNATYVETNTPRGKALMLDCLGSDALEDNPKNLARAIEVLYDCCYCGQCRNNCVSSYDHPDMVMVTRDKFNGNKSLLPEPVRNYQNLIEKNLEPYETPTNINIEGVKQDQPNSDVLVYLGPIVRNEMPEVFHGTLKILERVGVKYTIMSDERDAGYFAYLFGMLGKARELLSSSIERINALEPARILTLAPADYRLLMGGIEDLPVDGLKPQVVHITTFLAELLTLGTLKLTKEFSKKVTYHDSCQLGRFMEDFSSPREVLGRVPGIVLEELYWNKDESGCCGAGGGLEFTNPKLSKRIAQKRHDQIKDKEIELIITDCPNCKKQLNTTAQDQDTANTITLAELVSQCL
jgi:Fe-S oxidoreductase